MCCVHPFSIRCHHKNRDLGVIKQDPVLVVQQLTDVEPAEGPKIRDSMISALKCFCVAVPVWSILLVLEVYVVNIALSVCNSHNMCVLLILQHCRYLYLPQKLPNSKTGDVVCRGNWDNTSFKINSDCCGFLQHSRYYPPARNFPSPYQQYLRKTAPSVSGNRHNSQSSRVWLILKAKYSPGVSSHDRCVYLLSFWVWVNSTVFKHPGIGNF
jgi:hypothetical protein